MNFILNVLAGAGIIAVGLGILIALVKWGALILAVMCALGGIGVLLWVCYDVGASVRGQD